MLLSFQNHVLWPIVEDTLVTVMGQQNSNIIRNEASVQKASAF